MGKNARIGGNIDGLAKNFCWQVLGRATRNGTSRAISKAAPVNVFSMVVSGNSCRKQLQVKDLEVTF